MTTVPTGPSRRPASSADRWRATRIVAKPTNKDMLAGTVVSATGEKQYGPYKAFRYSKNRTARPEYDDKATALMAVKQYGVWIKYHSERLRDDEEVVLAAVTQDPKALEYASDRLQDNEGVVKVAMAGILAHASCAVLEFEPRKLFRKESRNFVLSLMKSKPHTFPCLPMKGGVVDIDWRDDKEVALLVLKRHPEYASYLTPRLWNDRDIILAARDDKEAALLALKRCPEYISHLTLRLWNDRDIILAALEKPEGCHWFVTQSRGGTIKKEFLSDKEIMMKAVKNVHRLLEFKNAPGIKVCAMQVTDWNWRAEYPLRLLRNALGKSLVRKLEEVDNALELKRASSSYLEDVCQWSHAWKQMLWYKIWLTSVALETFEVPKDFRDTIIQLNWMS